MISNGTLFSSFRSALTETCRSPVKWRVPSDASSYSTCGDGQDSLGTDDACMMVASESRNVFKRIIAVVMSSWDTIALLGSPRCLYVAD